jgi:hypothetical protein
MVKRFLPVIAAVTVVCAGGWVLAQPGRPDSKKPPGEPGRFSVAPAGNSAILLDTLTGKSWWLQPAGEGNAVWLPTRRFDTDKEFLLWQEEERARKKVGKPYPGGSTGGVKVPQAESLQYQAARIRAVLDEVDVRVKTLEAQQRQFQAEREKLFRDLEDLERRIKTEEGGKKASPK